MTQKEYKEEVEKLTEKIKKTQTELEEERAKTKNYQYFLEEYYNAKKMLDDQMKYNDMNCEKIRQQEDLIERYQKIIDKFTINC